MIYLTFLTAIALSAVAEFYSVVGLASIFPGSFWPIVLMGAVLGVAKLVTISWLYRNWKTTNLLLKTYLTTATVILMLITSMGIFGYLSKAHLEHSTEIGPVADKVAMYDEKIKISKDNIDANRKALKQMDEAVDQVMGRSTDEKGADKAVAIRRAQQKERGRLQSEIAAEQKTVAALNEERVPLANELRKAESDFGPIKYVAELIYGSGERDVIDKAVRLVIMLIMVVFDPLAVLLLIAGNISLKQRGTEEENGVIQFFERVKSHAQELDRDAAELKVEEPKVDESIKVDKENLATIEEKPESIVIDEASGESIPPLGKSKRGFPNRKTKQVEPNYDYEAEFAFKKRTEK
jgi:hypothetical protein